MTTNGQCDYEILFVDDGSKDYTEQKVCGLAQKDRHVKYYSFSRNFGKEAAMYAGFCNVTGDYAAVMVADLQDPPSLFSHLLDFLVILGYDCVASRRAS